MGERRVPEPRRTSRLQRAKLLVGRTAGAVPGALAGGAVAVGADLSLLPTGLLGLLGALLGAVAVTGGPSRGPRSHPSATLAPKAVEPGHTPPDGLSVER